MTWSLTYKSEVEGQRENKKTGHVVCFKQLVISNTAMTRCPITRQHKRTVGSLEAIEPQQPVAEPEDACVYQNCVFLFAREKDNRIVFHKP